MAIEMAAQGPTTLADFEGLVGDDQVSRKVFLHTVRDYAAFFDRVPILAANDNSGDKGNIITTYPEGELHGYDEGWNSETVTGAEVRYTMCRRSSSNTIDYDKYMDQPASRRNEWRLQKDKIFARGFARATVRTLLYGDPTVDKNACRGICNIVTPSDEVWKDRIIDAGGTTGGKLTEIILVGWNPADTYCFHNANNPESDGGFRTTVNMDKIRVEKNGKHYYALETDFRWDIGVALYNPLSVVRITNIDTTKLYKKASTSGSVDLPDLFTQALNLLPDEFRAGASFYCNDIITGTTRRQLNHQENLQMTYDDFAGRKLLNIGGIPIFGLGNDVISVTGNQVK